MKSITIHNLDDELYLRIRNSAKSNRRSLNQEIKDKLIKYFLPETEADNNVSFKKYLGIWSGKEFDEFDKRAKVFETVSDDDWKE
jgi:plasmid stability protein